MFCMYIHWVVDFLLSLSLAANYIILGLRNGNTLNVGNHFEEKNVKKFDGKKTLSTTIIILIL